MVKASKIKPFLWFEHQAEEAAKFYTSIFKKSKLGKIARYPEGSPGPAGQVMTVEFQIEDQDFIGLNGGPQFKFNEAVSFQVICANQEEVDYYWERLSADGDPTAQQCGWLKDRFGVSWQVVPVQVQELLDSPDPARRGRVMEALLAMKKLDIAGLERAYAGAGAA
jgi:predicted 3-demethylubiquinone-9 3-methyltransferase (glyoxalase superfamily)